MPRVRLPDNDPRRKRRPLSLEQKGKVLDMLREGKKVTEVARQFKVNESTIRTIRINSDKIRESLRVVNQNTAKVVKNSCNILLMKVDKLLAIYVRRKERSGHAVSRTACCEKAVEFYDVVARKMGVTSPAPFKASRGWLQAFYKRHDFKHKKRKGEQLSADIDAARNYPVILKEIIEEGGYTKDQIFNADETALYWKAVPTSTYISKETKHAPGFKAFKTRITLLLGCNASGTCKLKPLVLHTAKNPRAYKNIPIDRRGVHWRWNKKAWMTATIMNEWFDNMFVPEVRQFCRRKNLDFKCLLLLDNAPGHSSFLIGRHPNVKVVFLPARTTSIIQPMDQELIATMKAIYCRKTFRKLEQATDISAEEFVELVEEQDEDVAVAGPSSDGAKQVLDFWKAFNIKNAMDILISAWDDVSVASVLHAWRRLLPEDQGEAVDAEPANATDNNSEGEVERQVAEAVSIARRIPGFDSVTTDEVLGMVQTGQHEPTVEEMVEVAEEQEKEESDEGGEDNEENAERGEMTQAQVRNFLAKAEELKDLLEEMDPKVDRAFDFVGQFNNMLQPYSALFQSYLATQQQSLITRYFRQPPSPRADSPPPLLDAELEDILAQSEDEDAVSSYDFHGFGSPSSPASQSDTDSD